MIKLLGLLPAVSRIKSIEFAKVKAAFGGTEYVGLFFFNDKASRRIFTDSKTNRRKGQKDPLLEGRVQEHVKDVSSGAWGFLENLFNLGCQCNSWKSWKRRWKRQKGLLLRGKEK